MYPSGSKSAQEAVHEHSARATSRLHCKSRLHKTYPRSYCTGFGVCDIYGRDMDLDKFKTGTRRHHSTSFIASRAFQRVIDFSTGDRRATPHHGVSGNLKSPTERTRETKQKNHRN
ncbi:unnamed protein product [Ixodes persulcatus]